MSLILLFVFQFICPIAVGLVISLYLRKVTGRLLVDLCGTPDRADFWVRVTTVLIITVPLTLVLTEDGGPSSCSLSDAVCAVPLLRQAVMFTLIGIILTVGVIALIVGRYVPIGNETQTDTRVAP